MTEARRSERGMTLVELLVSVVILAMLTGGLSAAFVTAFRISTPDKERVRQSGDAQVIAAYLVRDAQAAGGTNPSTAAVDTSLGVSTSDAAGCVSSTPGAQLKLQFSWRDRSVDTATRAQISTLHVASYSWVPSTGSPPSNALLQRTTCVSGTTSTSELGRSIASVAGSCVPACSSTPTLPDTVSLAITENVNAPAQTYRYTLTASLRPEGQTPPCALIDDPNCTGGDTGSGVPLLALGGGVCVNGDVGAGVSGSTTVHIYGGVVVNTGNVGNCPAMNFNGNPTYTSGPVSILNGGTCSGCPFTPTSFTAKLLDPFAGLTPPTDTCGSGANPSPNVVGGVPHYQPDTYPSPLSVNGDAVFDPGTYVLCSGLSLAGNSSSTSFVSPTVTNANAITTVSVSSTAGFSPSGGAFIISHAGAPYYFTYTGTGGGNTLTGVALVSGLPTTQFTNGDSVSTAVSSGPGGVLFYVKGGTISKTGGVAVALSPRASGAYAGLLIWQAAADTTGSPTCGPSCNPMSFLGNGGLALNGTIYAPTIEVVFGGTPGTSLRSIIAGTVTFTGNHAVAVGVPPPPLAIVNPASLPNWTNGVPYTPVTVSVTGGSGQNNFTASGFPTGLTINALSGVISGTPTQSGTFNAAVTDTDSFGDISTRPYTFTINGPPTITTASLPDWTVTFTYSGTPMTATGGTTTNPYTWSATNLPPGLSINASGVIVGSPTLVGTFNPTIKVTDSAGAIGTRSYTVHIFDVPTITGPVMLPTWTAGQAYPNQQMLESNGTPAFKWVASGLPTGLTIGLGTGLISGTPTTACTPCSVAVTLTDSANASATRNYTVTINPAPGIATATLPNAEVGRPYNFTVLPTAGGTPPYTWAITSGTTPWLSINSATGQLTGTPPATGAPNVTVRLTDSTGASVPKTYSLTIVAPVSISGPASLVPWTVNRDYPGTQIVVANGVANFTWVAPGLPTGMSIDSSGVISGTPTVSGTFPVAVTVTDRWGGQATANYSLVINIVPTVSTLSLPNGELTVGYSAPTMTASGGTSPYTWTDNGLSTIGLSVSSAGVITGTPTAVGTFSVTLTAKDAAGATGSKIFSLTVNPAPVNNLSLGNQSGGTSLLVGNTIYYHGAVAGSLTITNVITNASGGGPASSNFPTLGGTSTGFTHVGSIVSTPAGGPFTSTVFSWNAGTSSSPTEVVTGADTVGDTASTTLTFVNDSTAPAPTVSAIGNVKSTTPIIGGTAGTQAADATHSADSGTVVVKIYSGPTTGGALLQTFTPTIAAGTWSVSESALAANAQYTVQVTQTDALGNTGSATRTFVIDTVAPTVTASMSSGGGTSKITISGTAGTQVADAAHSADIATVTVNLCTQANYTSHANVCATGWEVATFPAAVGVAGGTYTTTTNNIGNGTYYATVTQADAAGNVGSVTTGPFVR